MQRQARNPLHALIREKGQAALAREMGVSTSSIQAWIKNERLPAARAVDFASIMEMSVAQVMEFVAQERPPTPSTPTLQKPRGTLETLLEVQRGELTLEEASERLNVPKRSLKVSLAQNGPRLFLLYRTLTDFSEGRITVDEATTALGKSRQQVYHLCRKYGIPKPRQPKKHREPGRYTKNREIYKKLAFEVIAGRTNVAEAANDHGVSERSLHRYVTERIMPHKLNEMSHWMDSFRLAFAAEKSGKGPALVEKLVEFAQTHCWPLPKTVKLPDPVSDWRKETEMRLLIAILTGEATLEEVAALRRGSQVVIRGRLDGMLRSLDPTKRLNLDYSMAMSLPVVHQIALAELLIVCMRKAERNEAEKAERRRAKAH